MSYQRRTGGGADQGSSGGGDAGWAGRRTRTDSLPIRRSARPGAAPAAPPGDAFAQATAGPAREVPHRSEMERAFGESFGGVHAHTGTDAAAGLDGFGAVAAAQGETVAFREPNPSKEVVAHELTHVVQQRQGGGGVQRSTEVSDASDPAEHEAESVATVVAAGGRAHVGAAASGAIHRQQAPAPAGSLEAAAGGAGMDVREIFVQTGLDAGAHVGSSGWTDIVTRETVILRARLTATEFVLEAMPELYFDVPYPADNVIFRSLTLDFATQAITVETEQDDDGNGTGDPSGWVADALKATLTTVIAATPVATPGYNPWRDPTPVATANAILAGLVAAMPVGGGGGTPVQAQCPRTGVVLRLKAPVENGPLQVAADRDIRVELIGGSSWNAIGATAAAGGPGAPQATADAAAFSALEIETSAITVRHEGQAVATLNKVTLHRGGHVSVDPRGLELTGVAGDAAAAETVFRLLVGLGTGNLDEGTGHPAVVHGLTREALEKGLTDGINQVILANRNAIPGIDLAKSIGLNTGP